AALAARLAPDWRGVAGDLRGRGESAYSKGPMRFFPLTYVQDVEGLLGELAVPSYIAFGTSLGGIVTMLLAGTARERIAGALLNDVGPGIETGGPGRIRPYCGQ